MVSSNPLVIRISSSHNPDKVQTAVNTVKKFLDNVGAWYKHHRSKKSDSEYLLVERPEDRLSPEVDVRVSDHGLPDIYQQPDLDVDPDSPGRAGSYSVPEALDLLEGFFDGEYRNIVEGEPIVASFKRFINSGSNSYPVVLGSELRKKLNLYAVSNEEGQLLLEDNKFGTIIRKWNEANPSAGFILSYQSFSVGFDVARGIKAGEHTKDGQTILYVDSTFAKMLVYNPEQALKSIVSVLSHEDVHRVRREKSGGRSTNNYVESGSDEYYFQPEELPAMARTAVEQILHSSDKYNFPLRVVEDILIGNNPRAGFFSSVLDVFISKVKNKNPKAYQKFLREAINYLHQLVGTERDYEHTEDFNQYWESVDKPIPTDMRLRGSSYTPLYSDNKSVILSSLVPATVDLLNQIQRQDIKLWTRLATPVESDMELSKQYKYIITRGSLVDFINDALTGSSESGLNVYFSMVGSLPGGLFLYVVDEDKELISDIKTLSFKDEFGNNTVLLRDVIDFIKGVIPSYNVSWYAKKDHPYMEEYIKFAGWYGVKPNEIKKGTDYFSFFIPKGSQRAGMETSSVSVSINKENFNKKIKNSSYEVRGSLSSKRGGFQSKYSSYKGNAELIESATAKELIDENNSNPSFKHRAEHLEATKAQGDSEIMRAYANTLELRTKSEKFKTNKKYYRQWILFKDFKSIARDKKIKFEDAIDYSLNFGDVNIRCSCPSQLYHGYSYMGDQLGYLYGLPREGRFPKVQNPNLQLATCKHVHIALQHILNNKEKIIKMFGVYYKRLDETPADTMIAVPAKAVEEKEETLEDFMDGFDEDGNEVPKVEGIGEDFEDAEVEVEEISVQDPDTGVVKIDSKLAEKSLPPEQQVKYAGEEDEEPVNENTLDSVADSVSDEEVDDLASQIDEVSTDGVDHVDEALTT